MINIVVFNWNYGRFLSCLLNKMIPIFNDERFRIFICDDGSTDNSLEIIKKYIADYSLNNLIVIESEIINLGRDKPFLGQIENLNKVIKHHRVDKDDYYWLMDADDYFDFSLVDSDFYQKVTSKMITFTKVKNISDSGESYLKIKRNVLDSKSVFPTISVTSSIIFSGNFLSLYYDEIFTEKFNDLWLDSRINMLACLLSKENVAYINEYICRVIHTDNDSGNMSLSRFLRKQIVAYRYFKYINKGRIMMHPRMLFISVVSKCINDNIA